LTKIQYLLTFPFVSKTPRLITGPGVLPSWVNGLDLVFNGILLPVADQVPFTDLPAVKDIFSLSFVVTKVKVLP